MKIWTWNHPTVGDGRVKFKILQSKEEYFFCVKSEIFAHPVSLL